MATKAVISSGYRWRLALIALMFLGWALWSLYDGVVGYPNQIERAETYLELEESGDPNWAEQWQEVCEQKGWSTKNPGKPKRQFDLITQWIQLGITLPIGLLFGFSYVRTAGRWIDADEQGLLASWGQRVPFDAITRVNKAKWKSKGIAVVYYRDGDREKRMVLDDWKYDRLPTEALLEQVEAHVDRSQIEGDVDAEIEAYGEGDSDSASTASDEANADAPPQQQPRNQA